MIGLSTYALFWELSDRVPAPLTLAGAVDRARELGLGLLQICDYAPIEHWSDAQLAELRRHAGARGVALELGTKGLQPERMRRFLHLAEALGATLVRTMFNTPATAMEPEHRPTASEAEALLREVLPEFEAAGVTVVLETYEQAPTKDLLAVVQDVAPYVLNMHIKDFAFARQDGWVGFVYTGAPMGEGLLDYDHMAAAIRPAERSINQIIEHWLPWQGSAEATLRTERQWTQQAIDYLRSKGHD